MIIKFHCTCGQKVSATDDIVGSALIALFLKLTVRIVGRFALAFSEAWLVSLFTTALNALVLIPAILIQTRMVRFENGLGPLVITASASILLTIVAYSYLIR